ncbi:MCE family protein [Aureibaculum sp. A20]|uniref:MCE family protein n=1 Tax=Aureibaculum flavum TaxID=2795986 RepID=A0ABS0WLN6_9FLAO|nr:MlaD family protein [Aureibaculum flavum]MBJ2172885.1 MCE family protein [Aureibaculum flavum]
MQQTKTQKFKLGLFIIVSTLLLIIALYFIGNKQNIFGKTFRISAVFNNVNGLQLGNNVRYSGINVGTVKSIEMINDTTICVDMIVEDKILQHLKKNALAAISSDGLVGSMIINIVPVKESSEALMSGDTIKSFSKISTSDMMSTLNTTNENAALLTSDLLKITTEVNQGKGTLGMLINDENLALNIKETFLTLKSASISASETIDKLNKIMNSVNYNESVAAVLLSDSISAKKMKSIIQNLDYSSSKIDSVLNNINNVVLGIKSGDGALNYMINDTVFVKNIDSTMMNLKDGSTLLNENLEALKHNFLFRGYFKKLEKKKLKVNNKDN